jgi:5'-nucleotidase
MRPRAFAAPATLLFAALVLAASLLSACAGSRGAAAAKAPGPLPKKLVVVGINDTHGALLSQPVPRWLSRLTSGELGGADWFGGYLNAIRAAAQDEDGAVVLLDAGDMFQGTLISNQFGGRSVVDVYDALGVDAAAIGNHEFDFGLAVLEERIAQARFPFLAANVFLKGTRTRPRWARPSALLELGGLKVGIIGLSTVETPIVTRPAHVKDLEFAPGGPIAAELADELRSRGAQVVLLVAHMGRKDEGEILKVAEACRGKVDAIVSGHHHETIGPPPLLVANIPVVQSGAKLQAFSVIELTLDRGGRVSGVSVNRGSVPRAEGPMPILHTLHGAKVSYLGRPIVPDPRIAAIVQGYDAQVRALRETRIGETQVELRKGGRDDLLANLAADALRSGVGGGLPAQYAFQNSGGLRVNEIPAGPITFGQLFDLYPFDNRQIVLELSAADLRGALEGVLRAGKGPLKVSGLRYTIDRRRLATADARAIPAGALVTKLTDAATGAVLCETRSCSADACDSSCVPGAHTLSLTDFLAEGGDGVSLPRAAQRTEGPVLVRDVIVAYVKQHSPLSPRFLGSTAAGGQPRLTQVGLEREQGE